MSASRPQLEDCVHRFRLYGRNLGTLCEEPDDYRYALRPLCTATSMAARPPPIRHRRCVSKRRHLTIPRARDIPSSS